VAAIPEPGEAVHANPEESLEDLYEEAPCGYVSWSVRDGVVARANRTLLRWIGRPDAALAGRPFRELLTPPGRILHETRHAPPLRAGRAAEAVPLELACAGGARLPVLATSVLRPGAAGAAPLIRTTLFDATVYRAYEKGLLEARDRAEQAEAAARRAQLRAEAAERAKAGFLAAMNHEFRTPIGIVSGFASLLLQEAAAGRGIAQHLDWLGDIDQAAQHLLALLEDATRFARLDGAEAQLGLVPLSVRRLAADGLRLAAPALEQAGVTATILPDTVAGATDLAVLADAALLAEAIGCALRDVARRAPAGAAIHLECQAAAPEALLVLACPALVLPATTLQALGRAPEPGTILNRGLEGAGLGLEVARSIAELHGGRMQVGPDAGGGLRLAFHLPLPQRGS
jgi:sigma-B regulation protein RsbU (phosphoserine phosphatase)